MDHDVEMAAASAARTEYASTGMGICAPPSEPAAPPSEPAAPRSEPAAPRSEPAAPPSEPAAPPSDLDARLDGVDAAEDLFLDLIIDGAAPPEPDPDPDALTVEQRVGLALLRLRLYRGWSQGKLERVSGVDQTIVSRFETGGSRGTSTRGLFAILRALRAEEVTFGPGPRRVPQSSWEDAVYGDLWERAGRVAERRVNRRRSA